MAFQISPIVLVDGIAPNLLGGCLPLLAITEAINFTKGLLTGGDVGLDNFFAHWEPMPGSEMISQQIATYPYANKEVAGNATIAQPCNISMTMKCPARGELGAPAKLASMIALRYALEQHNKRGGTYTVMTPSLFRQGGILLCVKDISNTQSHQPQNTWQFDFNFPLINDAVATGLLSSLMSKLGGGTQVSGTPTWSGASPALGAVGGGLKL
jgi:hypothetical protein